MSTGCAGEIAGEGVPVGACDTIGTVVLDLFADAKAADAGKCYEIATVIGFLEAGDAAGAADLGKIRRVDAAGLDRRNDPGGLDHSNEAVSDQSGVDHRKITRLENVQRQHGLGEEKGASQREDRNGDWKIGRLSVAAWHATVPRLDTNPTIPPPGKLGSKGQEVQRRRRSFDTGVSFQGVKAWTSSAPPTAR